MYRNYESPHLADPLIQTADRRESSRETLRHQTSRAQKTLTTTVPKRSQSQPAACTTIFYIMNTSCQQHIRKHTVPVPTNARLYRSVAS